MSSEEPTPLQKQQQSGVLNPLFSTWDWSNGSLPPLPSLSLPSIHPGHFFLVGSLPFCMHAYRGYQTPLERTVQDILQKNSTGGGTSVIHTQDLKLAEEYVRRSVGSAVAVRALRIATSGSIAVFGITTALLFYSSGCSTVEDAMMSTQNWAHASRRRLDHFFGITNRVDCDHPEYKLLENMTEEQEIEHVAKTYFPDEDWESEIQVDSGTVGEASQATVR